MQQYGQDYTNAKEVAGQWWNKIEQNVPEFAIDMVMFAGGVAVERGVVTAAKSAGKALKPAAQAMARHADEVISKVDDVARSAVNKAATGLGNAAGKIVTKVDDAARNVVNKVDNLISPHYEFFRLNLPQQAFAGAAHTASKAAGHTGKFADNIPANPLTQTLLREALEVTANGATKAAGHVDDLVEDVVKHKPKKIPANQKPLDIEKILAKVDDSVKVETGNLLELENALLKECRDGVRARSDFQNHHMVSKEVKELRDHDIWSFVDLDIENPLNKVLLPNKKGLHPTRSIHNGAHTEFNRDRLLDALDKIIRKGKIENWNKAQYNKAFQAFLLDERKGLIDGAIDLYANPKKKGKR